MRSVSDAFLRSLSGTHPIVARATLCTTFQTGVQPTGDRVPIVDGGVMLDGQADIRSSLDIVVNASWPVAQDDPLAPYGQELYVERGIRYDEGNVEYVGLGYHRIETLDQDDPNSNIIRVTAYDRMQAIIEGRLLQPRQFLNGTTFGVVVENLITEIYPDATIEWDDSTDLATLTRSIIVEDDRYGFLNDAITSRGKIWYWDHRGILVIKDVPDESTPVYEVRHGVNGVLVSLNRALSRANTRNAVVASGESSDTQTPVRGVATDDDPNSPTYINGSFGQVPEFFTSQFLETTAQCEAAAEALLRRNAGLTYNVGFGSIVNPALEPYDPVLVKFSHNESYQVHVLDTIDVPFAQGRAQESTTRERRVTLT